MRINVADLKLQKEYRRKPDFDWISILLILLAIGIVVGAIYFIFYFRESGFEKILKSESILSTIFVVNNGEETDTISLSFYNPTTKSLRTFSYPQKPG